MVAFVPTRQGMWLSRHIVWKLDPWVLRVSGGRIGMGLLLRTAMGAGGPRPARICRVPVAGGRKIIREKNRDSSRRAAGGARTCYHRATRP